MLNTGTGIAYSAVNGISESVARHNVQNAKEELRDSIIPVVKDFLDMLIETTADVYMELLYKKYPFIFGVKIKNMSQSCWKNIRQ